jgi:hypothetical protein
MSIQMSLSVPALERLIKDDSEIEVQLKQGVIANFVDKHLRSLLNDDLLRTKINELSIAVNSEAAKVVKTKIGDFVGGYNRQYVLNKEFSDRLTETITSKVRESVDRIVSEKIETYSKTRDIDSMITKYIEHKFTTVTNAMIEEKAKELLAQALKK